MLSTLITAQFDGEANFRGTQFEVKADFVRARFGRTVNFANTYFRHGVDFRQTYFDSVEIIYLENIEFPDGKLRFYWHQFRGKDSLRIKLQYRSIDRFKHYTRIEIIYHRLRDNFLAHQDKASADAVMYELGWQKKEILGESWWKMYGWILGWGYKPWPFIFIVVPVIISFFAVIWYVCYYGIVAPIVNSELSNMPKPTKQLRLFKKINIVLYDHSQSSKSMSPLRRAWHVIFFSTSVLLGLRFKKEWINAQSGGALGDKTFLLIVTIEWLLGIGLIVTFALGVKGARFGFIRDLLGF